MNLAIVGGGFSATALAGALAKRAPASFSCAIFSAAPLGPGTSYAPQSAALLMNGPVRAMSAYKDDPAHLARYLVSEPDDSLICRSRYGAYFRSTAANALAEHPGLRHIRADVTEIERTAQGLRMTTADGQSFTAQRAILALGNLAPDDAFLPAAVREHPGYAGDPWSASVEAFEHTRDVTIVGSRLTAMDTIALLDEVAYRGRIHVISRHGLLPHVEDATIRGFDPARLELACETPLSLLRSLRRALRSYDGDWRAVIESLRPITPAIWTGWSLRDRRRFLRHLQTIWAIHRYRVPPATYAAFERMRAQGRVEIHRGRITGAQCAGETIGLIVEDRGRSYRIESGYAINCTGPNSDVRTASNPLVRNALERGLIRPDALRMGIDVTDEFSVVAADGTAQPDLFAIGPLLRGKWYETTAVGEIRTHAAALISSIL